VVVREKKEGGERGERGGGGERRWEWGGGRKKEAERKERIV